MQIAVFGLGYVGSSISVLFARHHTVYAVDIDESRIKTLKEKHSPVGDEVMEKMLQEDELDLTVTGDPAEALNGADYAVIATNTELDEHTGKLRTSSVESVLDTVAAICRDEEAEDRPVIVIKSTVPSGYTKVLSEKYKGYRFIFCPEFLREKTAMYDVLHPSRVVIGFDEKDRDDAESAESSEGRRFAEVIRSCLEGQDVPFLHVTTEEAEAIKLFSNSYLATRIAFFNELDTFAKDRGLDAEKIIHGVSLDPRIGDWYNRPGPGFGGACLPKDIRQLIADLSDIPETLLRGVVESNEKRKAFVESDSNETE